MTYNLIKVNLWFLLMITAVIFDMDGVLADTQRDHARIESQLLAEKGISLTPEEITRRFAGVCSSVWIPTIMNQYGASGAEELLERLYPLIEAEARKEVREIPGASDLVRRTSSYGLSLGVASSSRPEYIDLVIKSLGICSYFKTLTSAREVENGKPAPDVFLLAAKRLGSDPYSSVVVEDGLNGMIGAYEGGFPCIGLDPDNMLDVPENTLRVNSLSEVTLERLMSIHNVVKIKRKK